LGIQLILYCLISHADWRKMLSSQPGGFVARDLTEALMSVAGALVPRMSWLVAIASYVGLSESSVLWMVWTILLVAGICLIVGLFCRSAAIAACFLHLCAAKSSALLSYGVDNFTSIGLFYLALSPLPDSLSLDVRWRNWRLKQPWLHGFWRRVLQLHLCVIYFFGGLTKLLGTGWWTGESLWRALTRPPFDVVPIGLLVHARYLLLPLGLSICFLETCYPIFIWPARTRPVWLVCVIAMHCAIAMFMGLYLFALVMIVLNVAAFANFAVHAGAVARAPSTSAARGNAQVL
jgi:hypothetical protein